MPTDLFYSTGQAARELGASQAVLRSLCASRAIDCETTAGGQYRIPKSVVERFRRDGLPPTPRPLSTPCCRQDQLLLGSIGERRAKEIWRRRKRSGVDLIRMLT